MSAALAMTVLMSSTPDDAFRREYVEWFEIESVVDRKLGEPWPPGSYRVLRLRPKRTGAVGIVYSFERLRKEGRERVERQFAIHILADDQERATGAWNLLMAAEPSY